MKNNFEEILKEVFLIDPSLKKHEEALKKIMEEIVKQKPDSKFDEAFKEELRLKLLERAEELIAIKQEKPTWFQDFLVPRNLSFALAGASLGLLLAASAFLSFGADSDKFIASIADNTKNDNQLFQSAVTNVASNAFGSLRNNQSDGASDMAIPNVSREAPATMGRGGNVSNFLSNETTEALKAPLVADSKMIMPYNPVDYEYVYQGEAFSLNNEELPVYKKLPNKNNGRDFSTILNKFDLGTINLNIFNSLKVKQITMAEEKDFGFQINVDFENESLSIYQNWQKWPRPDKDCRDDACFQSYRLKPNDVPEDKEVISLADSFVRSLGLDMSLYGAGLVQSYWRNNLNKIEEADVWIPEELTVIYPLKFDDKVVYDSYGNVNGLSINVNIRNMRISGAYQLEAQKYESSLYGALTDYETVMSEVKKGGFMNNQWYGEEGGDRKTVQVELGEPTLDLMKYYKYNEESGESEELLIPALIFPVKQLSDDTIYYNRKAITVPLIKEVIEENTFDNPIGLPRPMPLLEPLETEVQE